MSVVSNSAWAADFNKRKKVRDEARKRFFTKIGITPMTSIASLSISPADQVSKVMSLTKEANKKQKDKEAEVALKLGAALITASGLGSASPMAYIGQTQFDLSKHTVQHLLGDHFSDILGVLDE